MNSYQRFWRDADDEMYGWASFKIWLKHIKSYTPFTTNRAYRIGYKHPVTYKRDDVTKYKKEAGL